MNPYQLPNEWSVIDTQTYSAMAILAGTTDLRTIGRAVEKVKNAVFTGTPDATPVPTTNPTLRTPPQSPAQQPPAQQPLVPKVPGAQPLPEPKP